MTIIQAAVGLVSGYIDMSVTDKRKKVIAWENAATSPARVPWPAATVWLLMDRFHAPEWAWGIFWCFWGFVLIAAIIAFCHEDQVDIFARDGK